MPKLFISEEGQDSLYEIVEDEVGIGRGAASAVQIKDSHASKSHLVIRRIQGHFKLVDLESKNGVRVNGMFRNQHWLRDGDVIGVGHAVVRYAGRDAPQGPPVAVAVRPNTISGPVAVAPAIPRAAVAAVPAASAAVPAVRVAVPAVPAAAPPAAPSRAAAPAPAARRSAGRRSDAYRDDPDGDEGDDLPPPRRSSNSPLIVVGGIVGAALAIWLIFAMLGGSGQPHNLAVQWQAQKLADEGRLREAVLYAEQHGDPLQERYSTLLTSLESWKRKVRDEKDRIQNAESAEFYDKQIFRKQSIYTGWRAKYADPDADIVKRMREYFWTYRFTPAAHEALYSEQLQHPQLRDAMRQYATDEIKPGEAFGPCQRELDNLLHEGKYGEAVRLLEWERDRWKLILTPPLWKDYKAMVDAHLESTRSSGREQLQRDKAEVRKHKSAGEGGVARRKLSHIVDSYLGDPELEREVRDFKAELDY